MLSLLSPVEVEWFPVTCEIEVDTCLIKKWLLWEKNNQVWNEIGDRAGSYSGLTIVPLPGSIKDRSLAALLSCWTHAPHLAGRIRRSDREAWALSGPGIGPMYVLYWWWLRRTTRAWRATLVYLWYLGRRNSPRVRAVPVEPTNWSWIV